LPLEDDQLLSQEGIFGDEFGLASAKISEGEERQGGPERFGPMRKARREGMQAAILQLLERRENTSHKSSFSIT
jgi:hypothetical protein